MPSTSKVDVGDASIECLSEGAGDPGVQISFQHERGAKVQNATYLLDNSRLLSEFAIAYRPFRERVLQIINDIRQEARLPLVG